MDRYFAELPGTTAVREGWTLAEAALCFFPVTSLSRDTLAAAQRLIERPDLDPALRRSVVDCADTLERRLATRERFGGR